MAKAKNPSTELVPIDSLHPHERNPRRGDVEAIRKSLRVNGQYRAVVVRRNGKPRRTILAGNHTWHAAKAEDFTEIWATLITCDDQTAQRILLVDNRSNDLAGYDNEALVALLGELPSLEGTGWSQDAYEDLLAETLPPGERPDDDAPSLPEEPTSKLGDLYALGDHRLLCGSSTDADHVARLLDGQEIDLVVTDPPYGVGYQRVLGSHGTPGTPEYEAFLRKRAAEAKRLRRRKDIHNLTVENDDLGFDGTRDLVRDAFVIAGLKKGGAFYVFAPPGDMELAFRLALLDAGLPMRHSLVWVKDRFAFGRSDYHYRHESLLYGWRDGAAHYFVGDRTQDSVWECEQPKASKEHPTMKPVELYARALRNSSQPGQTVYDPFAGSGTALMAAEAERRHARLMELDPRYVDVIVARWENHTGEKAELVGAK